MTKIIDKMFEVGRSLLDAGAESIDEYAERLQELMRQIDEDSGFTPKQPEPVTDDRFPIRPAGINPDIQDLINQQFPLS